MSADCDKQVLLQGLRQSIAHVEQKQVASQTNERPFEEQDAFKKACELIAGRERSSLGLEAALVGKGFSQEAARCAVRKCKDYALLDDRRYAEALIRTRLHQGKGCEGIRQELASLPIDLQDGFWEDLLPQEDEEYRRAFALLQAHPPRSKNPLASAYRKLRTKGYHHGIAVKAAKSWFDAQEESVSLCP